MRLRAMMAQGADTLAAELDSVLGTAWDQALEVYRDGGDAGEVTWLSRGSWLRVWWRLLARCQRRDLSAMRVWVCAASAEVLSLRNRRSRSAVSQTRMCSR